MSNENWNNNAIQFPRLIAELEAVGGFVDEKIWNDLLETMDLNHDQLCELIDRAQDTWDKIKAKTCPPKPLNVTNYGFECDDPNCDYITQSEDDHIITEDGEYLCIPCAEKRNLKE